MARDERGDDGSELFYVRNVKARLATDEVLYGAETHALKTIRTFGFCSDSNESKNSSLLEIKIKFNPLSR